MILCFSTLLVGCKDEAWEDHYEQQDIRLENSLLTVLSADSELSTFLGLLKQTEYYSLLNSSQAFTIWAPTNDALSNVPSSILNDPDLLEQFVGNHVSRFSYNSSSVYSEPLLVRMLNGKYIEFSNVQDNLNFGEVDLIEQDLLSSNGILHTINDVLLVNPNIWDHLNQNEANYPILMDYLNQFNETVFDEENSVVIGTNTLGQTVYDSIFSSSNAFFKTIGYLNSEEERFTFIGLTDDVYTNTYDVLDDYYQFPVQDSIKSNTDKTIFSNLNFLNVELEDVDASPLISTTGNILSLSSSNIIEDYDLSNGNLFVVDQLALDPEDIIYKPIRYEAENTERRELASLSDFTMQKTFSITESDRFFSIVSLLDNPDGSDSNNYFEVSFSNVLSADYNIYVKFVPIGAEQQTKLKFEFSYVDENQNTIVDQIPARIIGNLEDGRLQIGDTYSIPVFINEELNNNYSVKFKVIVDVSEPELLLYDRRFGIDYIELVPAE